MQAFFRRTAIVATAALFALSISPARSSAQAIFGAYEIGDDDVSLALLGAAWSPGGLGWKPFVSVVGYNLQYDAGIADVNRNVILPTIGLQHTMATQSVNFGVGYAFADEDNEDDAIVPVAAPSGDGVVGSFGWDYWGLTNTRAAQVLASYNFGDQFLWTRGRYSQRLTTTSPLWVGGEVALLGGGDDPRPGAEDVWLTQFGPTLEYRFNPQFRLGLSGGLKVGIDNYGDTGAYGRIEFLWLPRAR